MTKRTKIVGYVPVHSISVPRGEESNSESYPGVGLYELEPGGGIVFVSAGSPGWGNVTRLVGVRDLIEREHEG